MAQRLMFMERCDAAVLSRDEWLTKVSGLAVRVGPRAIGIISMSYEAVLNHEYSA